MRITPNNGCGRTAFLSYTALALSSLIASPFLQAQTDEDEEIFELSPFTVSAESNKGYRATSTLAGTRLRTDMKDVAAPISVFTKELLEDLAASNSQEALLYSVNVENENEYAPDDGEGESVASTTQTRVRGIAAGTPTRGFFKTKFRSDQYNTETLTIARGPSAILFGLGSPSGVIDSSTLRAFYDEKQSGSVGLRTDNNGSLRGSFDLNVPLIGDKLAVRVAGMDQKLKTFKDPEFDDEQRYYLSFTANPLENTQIRASYEDMSDYRVRARSILMQDRITSWIDAGKPLFDYSTGLWTTDDGASWQEMPALSGYVNDGGIGYQDRVYMADGYLGSDETVQARVWENTGLSWDRTLPVQRSFTDDSIVPTDTNFTGLASTTTLKGDITNVVVEHKFTDDLYLELAYNNENYDRDQHEGIRFGLAGIEADANYYLPYEVGQTDGDLAINPNRGRYMVESEYLGYTQQTELEATRATLSYNLDFAKIEKGWLGNHNIALMYQKESEDNFKIKRRMLNQGDYWIGEFDEDGLNNIKTRYYLDVPELGGDSDGVAFPTTFKPAPWDNLIGSIAGDGIPSMTRSEVEGKLFVTQSAFLEGDLVFTFGYREDEQKSYRASFGDRNPVTQEFIVDGIDLNPDPTVQAGITRNHGLVYHTPLEWLSLTYNRSNAFNPQGNYLDWNGNSLPPGSGLGEDYGINLKLFEGKLHAKITKYSNTSIDNVEFDWYYEEPKWGVGGNMDASWGMVSVYAERLGNTEDIHIVEVNDDVRATRDFESSGYEMELFYQPTPQLDIRFTLAKTEAVNLRVVPLLQEYVDERYSTWEKYFGYPAWGQWDTDMPEWNDDWINDANSTGYGLLEALNRVEEFKASEGSATTRGRKWRSNLIANYRFQNKLERLSLGGAARWRSADTIGYESMENPINPAAPRLSDLSRPIKGSEIFEMDAWLSYSMPFTFGQHDLDWEIQLNIRNLLDESGFEPITVYTDGTYTAYTQKTPREFILSSKIRF
ncbi:hypothetical protein [Pelagicoccus sp. SDUM812002]|uniref:hypothetical protein n=1 Tax=Pelagicoccus sp. SDUM812002 TaxID=3041266 RepID=UPI00280D5988|nr:hypothetical protein [Pelagicoccus sp. SDUM812002]MDQ8184187.1 hypothetical protein [Pelagicoccus sp. SDUM812002]